MGRIYTYMSPYKKYRHTDPLLLSAGSASIRLPSNFIPWIEIPKLPEKILSKNLQYNEKWNTNSVGHVRVSTPVHHTPFDVFFYYVYFPFILTGKKRRRDSNN